MVHNSEPDAVAPTAAQVEPTASDQPSNADADLSGAEIKDDVHEGEAGNPPSLSTLGTASDAGLGAFKLSDLVVEALTGDETSTSDTGSDSDGSLRSLGNPQRPALQWGMQLDDDDDDAGEAAADGQARAREVVSFDSDPDVQGTPGPTEDVSIEGGVREGLSEGEDAEARREGGELSAERKNVCNPFLCPIYLCFAG
jgi:hypothetical protein